MYRKGCSSVDDAYFGEYFNEDEDIVTNEDSRPTTAVLCYSIVCFTIVQLVRVKMSD